MVELLEEVTDVVERGEVIGASWILPMRKCE
jgi:hypothetical protein